MTATTNRISLDTSAYVRVNTGGGRLKIQSLNGDLYVVLSDTQPSPTNRVAHIVRSDTAMDFEEHYTHVWVLGREDGSQAIISEYEAQYKYTYYSAYALGVTIITDTPVLTLKNPTANTQVVELSRISVSCDKKATFAFYLASNEADITGATFQDVNAGSDVQADSPDMHASAVKATAYNLANMRFVTVFNVQAGDTMQTQNPHQDRIRFEIPAGYFVCVTGTASNGIADVVAEWGEELPYTV